MKIIEIIKIMLTYRGDPKSTNINEKLSGLYWNNFFLYLLALISIGVISWLLFTYIFIPR